MLVLFGPVERMIALSITLEKTYGFFSNCAISLRKELCTTLNLIDVRGLNEAFCELKAPFSAP